MRPKTTFLMKCGDCGDISEYYRTNGVNKCNNCGSTNIWKDIDGIKVGYKVKENVNRLV